MKNWINRIGDVMRARLFVGVMALVFGMAAGWAQGSSLYWSGDGTSLGGTGTWDTATGRWGTTGAGPFGTAWVNANLDTAIFAGTVGAVTLGANIDVGGLWFNTTAYPLATTGFSLNFATTNNNVTFNGNTTAATITGPVGGTGNVALSFAACIFSGGVLTVPGTLTLNGSSAGGWSGTTAINPNMTVSLTAANQALKNTTGITLNGGGIRLTSVNGTEGALDRVADGATITVNGGGTISYANTSGSGLIYAETSGSVTLESGQLNILETVNMGGGGGNVQTLTLSGLTRTGAANSSAISFGSANGLNTTANIIKVTGASATAAGQIIGPWALYGTTPANPTDFAVYDASSRVLNASISANNVETTWGSGANITLTATATTLTGTRTLNSLRYNAGVGSINLGASAFNLETYGLLNGGSGLSVTNSPGGTGALTTPTGGGNLYLTPGNAAITVSAPITDNSGAVTLVKSGGSTLTLATTNTFTGGLVLNAGQVLITTAQSFTGGVTLNGGILGGGTAGQGISTAALNNNAVMVNGFAMFFMVPNETLATNSTITINSTGILDIGIANGGTATVPGVVSGTGTLILGGNNLNAGQIIKLTNTANTFSGNVVFPYNNGGSNNGPTLSVASLGDGGKVSVGFNTGDLRQFAMDASATAPLTFNTRQFELVGPSGASSPTIANNSAQAFTINTDLLVNALGTRTLTLRGTGTGLSTFAGKIGNGSLTSLAITKTEAGTWILSGTNNTYTGVATISAGTLVVTKLANGGMASSIGTSTSAAGNLVFASGAVLRYTGSGDSTDRQFTQGANLNNASLTIDASGTGAINFTSTNAITHTTTTQPRSYILAGSSTNENTLATTLANNGTNVASFTKSGIGTWVISGSNTFTGATTLSGGGTLVLDYSTATGSKLSDTTALTLSNGAGNLTLRGGSHVEVVGSLSIGSGGGHTAVTRDGGSSQIAFGAISRNQSGYVTLSLAEDNLATTTSAAVNGILTGGIFVGPNWAKVSSGNIVALAPGDYTALTAAATTATVNYQLTGSLTRGAASVNSLRLVSDGDDQVLNLGSGNLNPSPLAGTLGNGAGGGILYVGGGNNSYTIAGSGNLSAQNGNQELIINTYQGTLSVQLNLTMGIQGLAKTGAGTLVLSGNGTYSGSTFVNQGALRLAHATGAGTTGAITVQNNSALELSNGISVGAKGLTITGTGVANGGALRNVAGSTSTYGGAITIGTGGARINSDAGGSLTLTTNLVTSVFNNATIGGSGDTTISGVISGAGNLIKDGSGTLTLSGAGANTLSGEILINSGTLLIASTAADAIANTSTLRIASGAKLELADGVTETVGVLYLGGQPAAAGTWGGNQSGAANQDSIYFTGTGSITVSQLGSGTPYKAQGPAGTVLILK